MIWRKYCNKKSWGYWRWKKVVEQYQIDFKLLKEQNNETVGYIKDNNNNID